MRIGSEAAAGERELVEAVLRKDRKATAEFVELYADAVFGYVKRRLSPNYDQVDDVVQQVFLEAWESLATFRGDSGIRSWMLGIARHKVQDVYRARLRAWDSVPDNVAAPPGFDEALSRRGAAERVRAAMAQLAEPYRMILLWRYWEKRSTEEMARETGKTTKAVERLLARAREQFRRCYGE